MKIINVLKLTVFFLMISLNSSCQEKRTVEINKEVLEGIYIGMVNIADQTMEMNSRLVKNINGINLKFQYLMQDPRSVKTTREILPISQQLTLVSKKADDVFLNTLNSILEKEESTKNWFVRDSLTHITLYPSFFSLKNIGSSKYTTDLLGINSEKSIGKAEILRQTIVDYRNELILTVADTVKNRFNKLQVITKFHLIDFKTFKKYLESINHINKFDLLRIYSDLTMTKTVKFTDAEILWNRLAFHNQPLIAAISTLNSYRNKIRFNQETASKMLLSRIEMPLKPLYEYQK